jgi:hypothetical protein
LKGFYKYLFIQYPGDILKIFQVFQKIKPFVKMGLQFMLLKLGVWDKRGNRVKALKKVDQAIILVNKNKMDKANTLIQEAIELVKIGIEKGTKKK